MKDPDMNGKKVKEIKGTELLSQLRTLNSVSGEVEKAWLLNPKSPTKIDTEIDESD